jgi:hypothetical protein
LVFFDTNVLVDSDSLVKEVFRNDPKVSKSIGGVLCDFIEGEALNLKKGIEILEELKSSSEYFGYYFQTEYNSREGSSRALEDMPTPELKEVVLVEYDRKLNPSGMLGDSKEAKRAATSKSRFVDFSILTVATVSAFRRKRLSVIVSRDRWIKLSCKSLQEQFKLPIYCYDQWNFSFQEILNRMPKE